MAHLFKSCSLDWSSALPGSSSGGSSWILSAEHLLLSRSFCLLVTCLMFFPSFCLEVEKLARTLFLWKIEVHEQKEKVYEMRRWNEALVTNMLPEHVARHFLGSKKRDEVSSLSDGRCPPPETWAASAAAELNLEEEGDQRSGCTAGGSRRPGRPDLLGYQGESSLACSRQQTWNQLYLIPVHFAKILWGHRIWKRLRVTLDLGGWFCFQGWFSGLVEASSVSRDFVSWDLGLVLSGCRQSGRDSADGGSS